MNPNLRARVSAKARADQIEHERIAKIAQEALNQTASIQGGMDPAHEALARLAQQALNQTAGNQGEPKKKRQ